MKIIVTILILIANTIIAETPKLSDVIELRKSGKFRYAIAEFTKILERDPNSVSARIELGTAHSKIGEFDNAIIAYENAIEIDPKSLAAHYNLGVVLARKNEIEKAKTEFETAIALDPDRSLPYYQLGQIFAREANFNSSIKFYRKAIEKDPKNTSAFFQLANAYFRTGDRDLGENCLQKFHRLKAEDRFEAGKKSIENVAEAIKQFQRAIEFDKTFSPPYYELAQICLRQNLEIEAAIKLLKNAIENDPKPEYWNLLAFAFYRAERYADALSAIENALKLDPDRSEYIENRKKIKQLLSQNEK